ncbi:hypothetical protein RCL1_004329 [Eukaryota sp. TZLM3-RCL]
MDNISIIGDIETLKSISEKVVGDYEGIGLFLNVKKCWLIGGESSLMIGDVAVPFVGYSEKAFRFLGVFMGNSNRIQEQLSMQLKGIEEEHS